MCSKYEIIIPLNPCHCREALLNRIEVRGLTKQKKWVVGIAAKSALKNLYYKLYDTIVAMRSHDPSWRV